MASFSAAFRGLVGTGLISIAGACSGDLTTPADPQAGNAGGAGDAVGAGAVGGVAGALMIRCERRSGRSRISVDGNNLSPRNGTFSARVLAAGGTATSPMRQAAGDEAEFDFDSDRGDIAAGATAIGAAFIAAQPGPDVVGEILNSRGEVVASQAVECSFR